MRSMTASSVLSLLLLLLLLLPPVAFLLAVVMARFLAPRFAVWPQARAAGSPCKHAREVAAAEQRDHQLRVSLYRKGAGEVECVVCLRGVEEGDEVRELRCRHLFHRACLDRWLLSRPPATCPLCRRRLLAPCDEEEEEEDDDLDVDGEEGAEMVDLLMALVHSSSGSWFWCWPRRSRYVAAAT